MLEGLKQAVVLHRLRNHLNLILARKMQRGSLVDRITGDFEKNGGYDGSWNKLLYRDVFEENRKYENNLDKYRVIRLKNERYVDALIDAGDLKADDDRPPSYFLAASKTWDIGKIIVWLISSVLLAMFIGVATNVISGIFQK